jgi:cell division protein FtsQ
MRRLKALVGWRSDDRAAGRQRGLPRWMRRMILIVAGVLVLTSYFASVVHLTRNGWVGNHLAEIKASIAENIADAGFRVRSVRAHGVAKTEADVLRTALAIQMGTPILDLDLTGLQRRVEALPWVRVATVERSLPDTVVVRLVEREPLALWQHKGRVALIDETGATIGNAPLGAFRDLPILAGDGVPDAAAALMTALSEAPALAARVTSASFVEHRRWEVLMDGRVWVQLPQTGVREAWLRLAQEEQNQSVLSRDILSINIRNPDQWVFRLPPGGRLRMALEENGG